MGGCLTTLCSPIRAEREFEMAAHPERGTHEVGDALLLCAAPFERSENLKWLHIPREGPTKWEDAC